MTGDGIRLQSGTVLQPGKRMPSITLEGLPDDVYDALKRRAQRNQRSLNGEILHILRRMTVGPSSEEAEEMLSHLDALRDRLAAKGVRLDRELIEEARHEGRP